jgi:hypothetical protein
MLFIFAGLLLVIINGIVDVGGAASAFATANNGLRIQYNEWVAGRDVQSGQVLIVVFVSIQPCAIRFGR